MARGTPKDVREVLIYSGTWGFRYTCRDDTGKVVYDSPSFFRSRRRAKDEVSKRWPKAKVTFEV